MTFQVYGTLIPLRRHRVEDIDYPAVPQIDLSGK
jgi:hypothetical protein